MKRIDEILDRAAQLLGVSWGRVAPIPVLVPALPDRSRHHETTGWRRLDC